MVLRPLFFEFVVGLSRNARSSSSSTFPLPPGNFSRKKELASEKDQSGREILMQAWDKLPGVLRLLFISQWTDVALIACRADSPSI
jgi:hypothetical protein